MLGPRTYDIGGGIVPLNSGLGSRGSLPSGTYYLAVGAFQTFFGAFNFAVSSDSSSFGATVNTAQLNFRTGTTAVPAVVDLGAISDTQPAYATPDVSITFGGFAAEEVKWFMFTFAGTGAFPAGQFLDIDTTTVGMVPAATHSIDTRIALFDSTGKFVASDDNNGQGSYSRLSFGNNAGSRTVHGYNHVNLTIGK